MNVCLLCLERNNNDCIQVNSEKWNQQNINDLIDTHLWPMHHINTFSWICIECGRVLYDFHEFYKRVKIAQQNYSTVFQNEEETVVLAQNDCLDTDSSANEHDCKNDLFEKDALLESHLEPHIILEQPLPAEFAIDELYVKTEIVDDLQGNKIKFNRKRGRPAKELSLKTNGQEGDPLKKTRRTKTKIKKNKISSRKKTVEMDILGEDSKESYSKSDNFGQSATLLKSKDNDSETDPEQHENKQSSTETLKKKNHRNLDENTLKEYDKIIAENFKIFCNVCQIELDNFLALRRHFKVEHKQRGYARCCKRNFLTRSLLVDHIHVHLNPEYFKCLQCAKVFSDRSRLSCHKKFHEDDSKLDKCDICGKLFADKGALKKHVLTHSSEKLFPCTICGKYFTNSFILNHHIEAVHQNKFVQICDICGKSIRCPTAFASHMEKHEVKSSPISCDVCGLLLTNKEGLKRHKNSQHPEGGKKEHTCHICSKISPTLRALKSHIRSVHEQGFDYKCSLCEKSFKRPAVLKEHMATHTGTALYSCPWCPRTFISNGNMYNHRKNAHPKEWEELKRQKYAENMS